MKNEESQIKQHRHVLNRIFNILGMDCIKSSFNTEVVNDEHVVVTTITGTVGEYTYKTTLTKRT